MNLVETGTSIEHSHKLGQSLLLPVFATHQHQLHLPGVFEDDQQCCLGAPDGCRGTEKRALKTAKGQR